MINNVADFIREKLDQYLQLRTNLVGEIVSFLPGSALDPPAFPINKVTPVIFNMEEERKLQDPSRFNGSAKPVIRLNLSVLFVSKFDTYNRSLDVLSLILRFFQDNPAFTAVKYPELSPISDKLNVELLSYTPTELTEIWNLVGSTYLPSAAYTFGLVLITEESSDLRVEIGQKQTYLKHN